LQLQSDLLYSRIVRLERTNPMDVRRAVDQIAEIRECLARSQAYQGYRPWVMAAVGGVACLAAGLQACLDVTQSPVGYVVFWCAVATVGIGFGAGALLVDSRRTRDPQLRQLIQTLSAQFVPTLVAGVFITATLTWRLPEAVAYLPAIWALLFSQGFTALRPYLPPYGGIICGFYLLAGPILFGFAVPGQVPSPWAMGATFGGGHFLAAWLIYRSEKEK
jgi:hypothetical protein